jgi:cytochrome b6-f complex iron-sulfur subunit
MPCEHCLNRREFLARAGVAGVATLVTIGACGDGVLSGPGGAQILPPEPPPPLTIHVADFPGLANVGVLVRVPDTPVAVKRTGPNAFVAFSMRCTHQGCLVDIIGGQSFRCPCHFSEFANDGSVIEGPARDPLGQLSTSYDPGTDELTIG